MAHAQEPDFVFRRNGRVHLNRRGRQFSRLLAAEVCASAVVMLDTPRSEVEWRVLATHSIRQFPLHFPSRASLCAITFQLESTTNWVIYRILGWIVLLSVERIRVLCQQTSYNNCFRDPYEILPWRNLSWSIERFFINKCKQSHCGLLRLVRLPSAVSCLFVQNFLEMGASPVFFPCLFLLYVTECQTISFSESIQ